jgi:hypothetical protein
MRDKITSSDLMAYLMLGSGFLWTFITIICLLERDWNSAWMYSTTAALSFIVILFIDKERKRLTHHK